MTNLLVSLFPAMAFLTGFILGIAVIAAISWTAHRCDRVVKVPTLACLDLTPHVLWPFVIGVFSLAASYSPLAVAPTLQVVGLNLFVGSVAFFALQGLAVGAGALDRFGVRPGFRGVALVALAIIDVFTRVISFIGLLDFWVNFRRLPRDGATPPSAEPVVSDS
jgi:hypothetical protein